MTKAAEQCRVWILQEWPDTPVGRFACRNTASGGISQHSAYLGYDSNALDIFGPTKGTGAADTAHIQAIVDTIKADGEHKWSIRKILWQQKDHYNHAHIDFYPMCEMHKWCGGPETPSWKYQSGHNPARIKSRDPAPQNGLYDGSGSEPVPVPPPTNPPTDPGEDAEMEKYIRAQQVNLNAAGFKGANGRVLTVDGIYGTNTQHAEAERDAAAAASSDGGAHTHPFEGQTGGYQ